MTNLDSLIQAKAHDPNTGNAGRAPLRIAVVTETYAPEINGVANTMRHMVETLLLQGHNVELTRPRQACDTQPIGVLKSATDTGGNLSLRLVRGLSIPKYRELQFGLVTRGSLASGWRDVRPDVVHIVTEGPLGWAALFAARRLGIPVSSGFHTNFEAYSRHYGIGLFAGMVDASLRLFHNRCDATLVPIEQIRQALAGRGYERLAVVGRGIDTVRFNPERRSDALRTSWGCKADEPVAIYVGRLAPEKNLGLFIKAALAVREIDPRTRIVLVGDGPDAAALRTAHPDFVFAGMRRGDDLAAHYASADLFLFPSVTETFGNVTMEALASGLAVVAYDYAAARQHIAHHRNGLLVPFNNAAEFVATSQRLIKNAEQIVTLKQGARSAAENLSWGQIVHDLVAVLNSVVARRPFAQPAIETNETAAGIIPMAQEAGRTGILGQSSPSVTTHSAI